MRKPIPISLHTPRSADFDIPPLSRLDIAANSSHPLIALSFPYPFQALKLFLAHLNFCFERKEEYRFLVARVRTRCGSTPLTNDQSESSVEDVDGDADSGVDVSIQGDETAENGVEFEDEGSARGEIVGFVMWRDISSCRRKETEGNEEDVKEWDWLSQLPKGANRSLWKRYAEVMSSDAGIAAENSVEILKLAVSPQYQRRGVGTKLLKACIEENGDREIRVRASNEAKALYESFGWKCEKEFKLDLTQWGRCRTYVNYEMVRSADA